MKADVSISQPMPIGTTKDNFYSSDGKVQKTIDKVVEVDTKKIVETISELIDQITSSLSPKEKGPSECEAEFALKINAEGDVLLAKIGGEMGIRVKATWKR